VETCWALAWSVSVEGCITAARTPPPDGHGGKDAGRYYSATMPNNNDLAQASHGSRGTNPAQGRKEAGRKEG